MRIAFYGNVANNFYQIVSALRIQTQVDAHLYLDADAAHSQLIMQPESDTPSLKNNYPNWIHQDQYTTRMSMLFPWKSKLTKELNQYDAVVVSSHGPMFTQFVSRPTFFFVTGYDLTYLPFPKKFWFYNNSLKSKLVGFLVGFWQRRGIRRATEIWTQPYSPYTQALGELSISPDRISPMYFPLIIDTERFKFDKNAKYNMDSNIQQIISNHDFIVFHPSRLLIQNHPYLKASGKWKQNDLLFRGFAKLLRRCGHRRPVLVMPDRTKSDDIALGKRIIKEMGLERHVLWIKPPHPEGFTRDQLIPLYSVADVVADDFGIGWFGSVVLEACAISRPVVTHIDENVMSRLYPWHPILSANTEEGIANHLMNLCLDEKYKHHIGQKGREWIRAFHSIESCSSVYVKRISELCDRLATG